MSRLLEGAPQSGRKRIGVKPECRERMIEKIVFSVADADGVSDDLKKVSALREDPLVKALIRNLDFDIQMSRVSVRGESSANKGKRLR